MDMLPDSDLPPSGETADARPRYKPVDLDKVPQVDQLLTRLGLGTFHRDSIAAPTGRNDVWCGPTTAGRKVFVKRITGSEQDAERRMRRMLSFEDFVADVPDQARHGPVFLGADTESRIVVFELLEDARSGAELLVDDEFDDELASSAGRLIGSLHNMAIDRSIEVEATLPPQPSTDLLHGIPQRMFDNLSFGEVSAWRLMQQDPDLLTGIERLRQREKTAPPVPAHGDLRVDQFMVSPRGRLHVTDWEEFRYADGARDVGSFTGEWLNRSVLDIVTGRGDSNFTDVEFTHDIVVQRGTEKMERLLPRVRHFWAGYRQVRNDLDASFAVRATAFAGWHLLDRLIAGASKTARLSGIQRAAAGIGRAALLAPERFVATVGLD